MGKNWRGGKGGGRDGGGKGGGGGGDNSFASCKGHGVILASCDTAREREANKEIINIVDMIVEEWENSGKITRKEDTQKSNDTATTADGSGREDKEESMADLLAAEIAEVKKSANRGQNARIINTGVKGMALIKITRRECCPLEMVRAIFAKVKEEKKAYSKHLVRLIPLKFCFYPDEWDLVDNVRVCMETAFPGLQLPPKLYSMTREEREKQKQARLKEKAEKKALRLKLRAEQLGTASKENENAEADAEAETDADADADNEVKEEEGVPPTSVGQKRSSEEAALGDSAANAVEEEEEEEEKPKKAKLDDEKKGEIPAAAAAATTTAVAYPPFSYHVRFKARNHNTITKEQAGQYVKCNLPSAPMAKSCSGSETADVSATTLLYLVNVTYHNEQRSFSWNRTNCGSAIVRPRVRGAGTKLT
jgi:hypothetical protein